MKQLSPVLVGIGALAFVGFGFYYLLGGSSSNNDPNIPIVHVKKQDPENMSRMGDSLPLHTTYFDVWVTSIETTGSIPGTQSVVSEGNQYLIVNATYQNTDTESRSVYQGSLFIRYNNKDYEYDSEDEYNILNWGFLSTPVNPLAVRNVKIAYIVPKGIHGQVFYRPGRSERNYRIYLGKL